MFGNQEPRLSTRMDLTLAGNARDPAVWARRGSSAVAVPMAKLCVGRHAYHPRRASAADQRAVEAGMGEYIDVLGHPTWVQDAGGDSPPLLLLHGGLLS